MREEQDRFKADDLVSANEQLGPPQDADYDLPDLSELAGDRKAKKLKPGGALPTYPQIELLTVPDEYEVGPSLSLDQYIETNPNINDVKERRSHDTGDIFAESLDDESEVLPARSFLTETHLRVFVELEDGPKTVSELSEKLDEKESDIEEYIFNLSVRVDRFETEDGIQIFQASEPEPPEHLKDTLRLQVELIETLKNGPIQLHEFLSEKSVIDVPFKEIRDNLRYLIDSGVISEIKPALAKSPFITLNRYAPPHDPLPLPEARGSIHAECRSDIVSNLGKKPMTTAELAKLSSYSREYNGKVISELVDAGVIVKVYPRNTKNAFFALSSLDTETYSSEERQAKIISQLLHGDSLSASDVKSEFNITIQTARFDLRKLRQIGLITMNGVSGSNNTNYSIVGEEETKPTSEVNENIKVSKLSRQKQILRMAKERPIKSYDVIELFGVSEQTAINDLNNLIEYGFVDRISAKGSKGGTEISYILSGTADEDEVGSFLKQDEDTSVEQKIELTYATISEYESLTLSEISRLTQIPPRTLVKYVNNLRDSGKIFLDGKRGDKKSRWSVAIGENNPAQQEELVRRKNISVIIGHLATQAPGQDVERYINQISLN